MSDDVRPLILKQIEEEVSRPLWLRTATSLEPVRPPFMREGAPDPQSEAAEEQADGGDGEARQPSLPPQRHPSVPPRHPTIPPRRSVPPAPVSISRNPPPPSDLQAQTEASISEEQEAFAHGALELASMRARLLSQLESELIELAVHVAEVFIEREIEIDPGVHGVLARTAIEALGEAQSARLRVSREAYRAISEVYGEAAIEVDGVSVELLLDHSIEGLGVIAESGASRVDGRIKQRLAGVMRALLAEHRRNNAVEDDS